VRELAYRLVRRSLPQARRTRLKAQIAHWRQRLAPLYRWRHGTFTASDLIAELDARVAPDTEIVMVHCSLNDLQPAFTGTPRDLLDALTAWCGDERTLAMPAFFFGGADGDPVAHYRRQPRFDARRQPSEMGLLSELFRRRPGVRRSLHPTTSVCALGPLAEEIVAGHHRAGSTYGEGTPFAIMAQRRTAIVGLGTPYYRCLTQVHAAEDLLGERYPLALRPTAIPVEIKDVDGRSYAYELPINAPGYVRRLKRLERLMSPGELVQWRFHGVSLFVTSAARVTEVLIDAASRGETLYAT
jgi:aminoglycoside 3-N-acetyltransferase